MNAELKITKYQAAGNDFVMITDPFTGSLVLPNFALRYALCHRRFGVGADGLIVLDRQGRSGSACNLHYYNSDGARGSMCGNGARAALACARDQGWFEQDTFDLWVDGQRCHHGWFRALNPPYEARYEVELFCSGTPELIGPAHWFVDTGSPHQVIQLERGTLEHYPVARHGKELRHAPAYAQIGGTNVNYFEEIEPGHIAARTFERGVEAETWACGTGAAACALAYVAALGSGLSKDTPIRIDMPGGQLSVRQGQDERTVLLGGPAGFVFEATLPHRFVLQAAQLVKLPHQL
jgi:diaminopimelate epimerase